MDTAYVVVVQCEKSHHRCSGFHCAHSFYSKTGCFVDYDAKVKYLSFTCGGCAGKGLNAKLANLAKTMLKKENLGKSNISLHFASCITNDNHHAERCIFLNIMQKQVAKLGFNTAKLGSYVSQTAEKKRAQGIYKTYE